MSAEFPFVGTGSASKNAYLPLFTMYSWDFEKDCFIYDGDGKHILLEGNDALKVWIYKALRTQRGVYLAYTWNYGADLKKFIGKIMGVQERKSELRREITETLMTNAYIKSIDKMDLAETDYNRDLQINITLTTIYGQMTV